MNSTAVRTEHLGVPSKNRTYIFAASHRFDKRYERKREREKSGTAGRARASAPNREFDLFERGENLLFFNYRRVKIF